MKKVLFIPLTIIAGALAIGYASQAKSVSSLKAEERVTHIEMNADAFEDYAEEKGGFANADARFWGEGYSFNALEPFFRGETNEGWTGTLQLKAWKQYTQYIRFQWGGAHNIENNIKLEIHYGEYSSIVYNETFSENPLMMDYFKIPDEQFALLDKDNGFDMYIKFIDERTSDYGFHNFGCLYVNQNVDEVSAAMRYYLNHIDLSDAREWKVNNNKTIFNFYLNDAHLKEVFLKTVSNVDEDFENVGAFLNNWYIDVNYDNSKIDNHNIATDARHPDNLLSNRAVRDGSNMPFNKTDAQFFSGWYESVINQGYIASDYPVYRFVSRPFVLSGTGLVSVKMAGRSASLHVIDADTQQDLAWADLRTYSKDGDENRIFTGFNTVTMVRHYINLSEYLGKKIQLAIADVYENEWAASYFDELITHYETYPSFGIDLLFQDNNEDKTYSYHFDQYIASTHIGNDPCGLKYVASKDEVTNVDESSIYQAYKFLRHYYDAIRSPNNQFNLANTTEETRRQIFDEYMALDATGKQIVNNSSDLQYNQPFDDEWHRRAVTVGAKIEATINTIVDEFITYTVSFNANGGTGTMDSVSDLKGNYTLPECTFTAPAGQEFAGWKVNNTGDLLDPGAVITVNADTEIFAQWKDLPPVTYTVSFNANGGTGTMNAVPDQHDDYVLPENGFTAPAGQRFAGWKVNNTGDLLQPGAHITVSADVVLYAQWEDIVYTVSFNANGGSGAMSSVTKKEGATYALPECSFTAPANHKFIGWRVNGEGQLLQPGASITVTANVELVAQWEEIVIFTITFNANGGTGTMANMQVERGQQLTLPACTFVAPQGKEFDCWIVKNTLYAVGDKVDIISNTEVFAKWKNIKVVDETFTVSFDANGGTGTMESVTDVKGDYTLPQCTFVAPQGKEFDCWLIGNERYQPGQVISINSNTTVVASWKNSESGQQGSSQPTDSSSSSGTSSSQPEQSSEPTSESSDQGGKTPVTPDTKKGCGGDILSSSILLSCLSLLVIPVLISSKKNKKDKNK